MRTGNARGGFTLVELLISTALATVVTGGLAGALFIAGQSLEPATTAAQQLTADLALAELHRDVQTAVSISELTTTSVSLAVPDRTGDAATDTLRYSWSGVAGDPLLLSLNGSDPTVIASNVQQFSLNSLTRLIEGLATRPIILFVSSQPPDGNGNVTASADEQLRIDAFDAWGFDTTVISQNSPAATFDSAFTSANVVYVPATVSDAVLSTKLNAAAIGVVTELLANSKRLGLNDSSASHQSATKLRIETASHYITRTFVVGEHTIATSAQNLMISPSVAAPDGALLATVGTSTPRASLIAVEKGRLLDGGATAPARRVQLPWGSSVDVSALNLTAHTLARRSVEWAAGTGVDNGPMVKFEEFSIASSPLATQQITIGVPPGTGQGDLLILVIALDGDPSYVQASSPGWNPITLGDHSDKVSLGVGWKIAGSAEPSCQISWTGSEQPVATMLRFTGHQMAAPINAWAVNSGSSKDPVVPEVTTTVDNCLILRVGAFDAASITAGSTGLPAHTDVFMQASGLLLGNVSSGSGYTYKVNQGAVAQSRFKLKSKEEYYVATIAIAPADEVAEP